MKSARKLIQLISEKSIIFSAVLMLVLVVLNTGFLIYNNRVQEKSVATQAQAQEIKEHLNLLWDDVVRNVDIGVRGFAITKEEGMLVPYNNGLSTYESSRKALEEKLKAQGYPDMEGFMRVKKGYEDYLDISAQMVELVRTDQMEQFKEELKLDRGLILWRIYEKYANEVNAFQDKLYSEAAADYKAANTSMTYIQIILGIIGVPTLLFMITRIVRDERSRKNLFEELEKNNREYLFNPGTPLTVNNERELINNSILNFKKAASFISQVSAGNLEVDWEELSEQNKQLNQKNLAGELVQMREKMKKLRLEDSKRMWSTEGVAQFSEIIRTYQHDLQTLCDQAISFVVKYLSAQQGAVFLLKEEGDDSYLEMAGCYAFDRKKYVEKRVEIGQGLVGQVYLEKEPVIITNIPQAYTHITSGLGEATPGCLMVVPLKYNEKTQAVIEVASFKTYENYQLEWLDKVGEIMGSTLVSIRTSEKTQVLLEQFKEQAEQLRAQEEELRQNMEEMEATQEEMRRKEQELERRQQEMQTLIDAKN